MTRRIVSGRLLAAIAVITMASQGVQRDSKTEPVQLKARREDEYDQPAECDFVSTNRKRKRGGNGKGRKWWNN